MFKTSETDKRNQKHQATKILQEKTRKGRISFLVEWNHKKETTWEREDDVPEALIKKFRNQGDQVEYSDSEKKKSKKNCHEIDVESDEQEQNDKNRSRQKKHKKNKTQKHEKKSKDKKQKKEKKDKSKKNKDQKKNQPIYISKVKKIQGTQRKQSDISIIEISSSKSSFMNEPMSESVPQQRQQQNLVPQQKKVQCNLKNHELKQTVPQLKQKQVKVSVQSQKIENKSEPINKKINKTIKKPNTLTRNKKNVEQEDEEQKQQQQNVEKQNKSDIAIANDQSSVKTTRNDDEIIEVVAEVESSEDQQYDDDEDSNKRFRVMKEPKAKVSKTKKIKKPTRSKLEMQRLDEENIIDSRKRAHDKVNYKDIGNEVRLPVSEKTKINFNQIFKDFQKAAYVESSVVNCVIDSGMIGPYKYYLLKLKNNQMVYIRAKDMQMYFPRKLHQFYQRILNKVAKSTQSLNFIL